MNGAGGGRAPPPIAMTAPPFGLGFRPRYFGDLADQRPRVDWLEVVSENVMAVGGRTRRMLHRLRADYPLVLHGVSLSIAGADPLDPLHLDRLRALADEVQPRFVTDHLSWTSWRGRESHDLLPVAYTGAALAHVAARVERVQDRLGRRLYLENPTTYVAFAGNEMDEAEFLAALCRRSGCGVLLDVNNLYVNAANLGWDPQRYLDRLAPDDVAYFHVAGHAVLPDVRVDTHDAPVPDPVWELYRRACARFPAAGTVLERDGAWPDFDALVAELDHARALRAAAVSIALAGRACARPGVAPAAPSRAPSEVAAAFFAAITGAAPPDALLSLLADGAPVSAARGLAVYREAFAARMADGLAANFPTLRRVLGAAAFARLVAAYLARHPPRGYAFSGVGASLASFIPGHDFSPRLAVPVAVLADIAAFEQAELEVSQASDDGPPLPVAALAEVAEERWPAVRVRAAAAVRVVRCSADVLPVVEAVAAGRDPRPPAPGAVDYLICRPGEDLQRHRLAAGEAPALRHLMEGGTVESACAGQGMGVAATAIARLATLGLLRALA